MDELDLREFEGSLQQLMLNGVDPPNEATFERIERLRALYRASSEDPVPTLLEIARTVERGQGLLVNAGALKALIRLRDPRTIGAMIELLFVFDPADPLGNHRELATEGLLAHGEAAVEPCLALLAGGHEEANVLARALAADLSRPELGSVEATDLMAEAAIGVLGGLSDPRAVEALLEQASDRAPHRRFVAAVALAECNASDAQMPRVARALEDVYSAAEGSYRWELLDAIAQVHRPHVVPFLMRLLRKPDIKWQERKAASRALMRLANAAEAAALRGLLLSLPRDDLGRIEEALTDLEFVDVSCDDDLQCWISRLRSELPSDAAKACAMVSRYGRGDPAVVDALVALIDPDSDERVEAALEALDKVALRGSEPAVAQIDAYRRANPFGWELIETSARRLRAKLVGRIRGSANDANE